MHQKKSPPKAHRKPPMKKRMRRTYWDGATKDGVVPRPGSRSPKLHSRKPSYGHSRKPCYHHNRDSPQLTREKSYYDEDGTNQGCGCHHKCGCHENYCGGKCCGCSSCYGANQKDSPCCPGYVGNYNFNNVYDPSCASCTVPPNSCYSYGCFVPETPPPPLPYPYPSLGPNYYPYDVWGGNAEAYGYGYGFPGYGGYGGNYTHQGFC